MPPHDRIWEELTWSWVCSGKNPALNQKLDAAAKAAWPYARLCGWSYLRDQDVAHDLMQHAVEKACDYLTRHANVSKEKLTVHIQSAIRRHARQLASKKKAELACGSWSDLAEFSATHPDAEQKVYVQEVLSRLSPFAQSIVRWRWLGFSWREIAAELKIDHTVVRRAYLREVGSLVSRLSQPGGNL
jgi:DNA-directed RNA polymerase specialized sigma24 family protein